MPHLPFPKTVYASGVLFPIVLQDCFLSIQVEFLRFRGTAVDAHWELGIITQRFTRRSNIICKMQYLIRISEGCCSWLRVESI